MADEAKFHEGGLKLIGSVATFGAAGPPGLTVGAVIGAVGFTASVINFMKNDTTVADALRSLHEQTQLILSVLVALDQRLEELVEQVAIETNRQTLARLNNHLDDIQILETRLRDQPQDLDIAVEVANECGVIIDKFLRADFELWRWTDVVEKSGQRALEIGRFKNVPTLPVYLIGVLTWLTARERVVQAGQESRLDDDSARISRHLDAVSVRDIFDKYRDGASGTPVTIAENIKWRLRAWAIASTKFPEDRTCQFFFDVRNWMNGDRKTGDGFDLVMDSDDALCTVDPFSIGAPNLELDMETQAGVEILRELAVTLARVAATGSVREQLIGPFPMTEVFPPGILYVIAQNGDLHWYRNESSSQPGGSTSWDGPKPIGTDFHGFTKVFNGGGAAIYAIQPDGILLWYGYDGFVDGSLHRPDGSLLWRSPMRVGHGWHGFKSVFSGGEHVIYGILPDGTLRWYRHLGAPSGRGEVTDWAGGMDVASGWQHFAKVLSGGDGVIYAINPEGVLFRTIHQGYLTGAPDWAPLDQIGVGWGGFYEVVASTDGVIYAFTRDGRVFWMRFAKPRPLPQPPRAPDDERTSGELTPPPLVLVAHLPVWEGPVEIKHDLPGFRSVFAQMNTPEAGLG